MRILALDLATARPCSWALRDDDGFYTGEVDVLARDGHLQLEKLFDNLPGVVVCEGAYLGPNAKTFGDLRHVCGRIEGAAMANGIDVIEAVQPSEWKAYMLVVNGVRAQNNRKAEKAEALRVARMLGAEPENDDQADAVCLAEHVWCRERQKARAR